MSFNSKMILNDIITKELKVNFYYKLLYKKLKNNHRILISIKIFMMEYWIKNSRLNYCITYQEKF